MMQPIPGIPPLPNIQQSIFGAQPKKPQLIKQQSSTPINPSFLQQGPLILVPPIPVNNNNKKSKKQPQRPSTPLAEHSDSFEEFDSDLDEDYEIPLQKGKKRAAEDEGDFEFVQPNAKQKI